MTLNEYQITCTYFFIFFPFFIVSLGFCLEYYAIINRFTWFLFSPWIVPNKNVFDSVFYPKKNNQLWQQKNSFHKKKTCWIGLNRIFIEMMHTNACFLKSNYFWLYWHRACCMISPSVHWNKLCAIHFKL